MDNLLRKAGFEESLIAELVALYESTFRSSYNISPFEGVRDLLIKLKSSGMSIGIVTSNTTVNVTAQLGPELSKMFDFIIGIDNGPRSKQEALAYVARNCKTMCGCSNAYEVMYVGDTSKDFKCSVANGFKFVGVNWGFEDMHAESRSSLGGFAVVGTVPELQYLILEASHN